MVEQFPVTQLRLLMNRTFYQNICLGYCNSTWEVAIFKEMRKWTWLFHKPDLCGCRMLQQVSQWDKCIDVFWPCVEERL